MKFKVFEGTWETALKACLKEGYRPVTFRELHKLTSKLPNEWFYSSTFERKGVIKNIKLGSIEQLNNLFEGGWRAFVLNRLHGRSDLGYHCNGLDDGARLVGVKEVEK